MHNDHSSDFLPPMEEVPFWIDDVEDYLEFLHGDKETLEEQHGELLYQPSHKINTQSNPRTCPTCKTVFHLTKRGGSDSCPFCRSPLNFLIA